MGFFDNLGKKASAAYDVTAEKTGKIAKEAKLIMKINENKSDINDLYKHLDYIHYKGETKPSVKNLIISTPRSFPLLKGERIGDRERRNSALQNP